MTKDIEKRASVGDHLRMAVAIGHIGVWELDTATGTAWRNARHDEIFGYAEPLESWSYRDFLDHVVEDDRERVDGLYGEAIDRGEEWKFECRIVRSDGLVRWISAHGRPLKADRDHPDRLTGHVIDITERKRNEEHLRLLTAELNHRLKNLIGSIGGLIRLSARGAENKQQMVEALESRLAALGRTHNIAMRDDSKTVSIAEILEAERSAVPSLKERIVVEVDPNIGTVPSLADSITLVFHELTTNAVKYGALSNDTGRVHITSETAPEGEVELIWREEGGPPVEEPQQTGFGSQLIRGALSSQARVELTFPVTGATCRITIPARAIVGG